MADGYIGKISAVVTANTSDLSRKLQGAVKDVDRFAQTLNRSVSASAQQATASLEKIFTPLQRLERKLKTALRFNIRTAAEVREIQSLTQAADQLNKPLDRLQQGFAGLSLDIQSKFAPALRRAQDQAIAVNETISRTGAIAVQQFRAAEQAVSSTSTALQRLSELQKQAGAGLTGRELQFSSPAALKALQDAAAASQRAGGLSPDALADGGITRQVQRLQTFRDAIARAASEVEELRLRPNVDLTLLAAAEKRLNNIIATTTKAQQQLDNAVEISQNVGAATQIRSTTDPTGRTIQQRVADINRAREAEQAAAAAAAETEAAQRRIADATRARLAVASLLLQVDERESELISRRGESVDVRARVQGQAAVRRAVEEEAAFRERAADAAAREAAAVERLSQSQNRLLALEIQRNSGASARQNAAAFDAATAGVLSRQAPDAGVFERQTRTLDSELQRTARLRQQFLALPEDAQQSLERERAALNNIGTAARDGAASVGLLAERNDEMAASIARANEELSDQARLARANSRLMIAPGQQPPPPPSTNLGNRLQQAGADRIRRLTGSANIDSTPVPGVFNEQAQRDIDALASRVGAVRQQLETLPNAVRTRFVPELQRAQQELIRLQNAPAATVQQIENAANEVQRLEQTARRANQALALPAAGDALEASAVRGFTGQLEAAQRVLIQVGETAGGPVTRAYERLRASQQRFIEQGTAGTPRATRAIERLQQALARAAADTGRISFSRALREVQRGGDIARGSFGNAQLAIQQGIFAVDDFLSVTGGLEQRLRAVGNNLTQLGFIIGGTTGLMLGLGAVIGGQVILGISKFIFRSGEAEDAAKALNGALESQRSRVQQLADEYARLAAEIAKSVDASGNTRSREAEERQKEARQAVIDTISANSPSIAASRGQQEAAKRRREAATTPFGQIYAAEDERSAARARRAQERLALGQSQRLADQFLSQQGAGGPSARLAINAEIAGLQREIERIRSNRGFFDLFATRDADISPLQERVSRLRGAQTIVQQRQAEDFLQRGQRFADRASGSLGNVTGFSETQNRLNSLFADFEDTISGITDGSLSPQEVELATERFSRLSAVLDVAITTVGGFAKALDDGARGLADTVVQELKGREDQARRAANAAEAEFGPGSSQAQTARRDERLIAAERRRAEERRQGIDEEISRRRRKFEEDALAGRGSSQDVDRAKEIAKQRQIEEDQTRSVADREEARLRRQRLELEQQQSFEGRREVQQLRSQADQGDVEAQRRIQEIEGAARAREQARSEVERRRLEIQSAARDLGAGQRLGDLGPAQIQQAGINLAQSVAPAFAQLRDELLNARLQGPSRAALTVADVNTAEGSRELNRLIRGDDAARDVNLVELQTQSRLLEEIKVAIQAETAVVVDL